VEAATLKLTPLTKPRKLLKPRGQKPLTSVDTGGGDTTVDADRFVASSDGKSVGKSAEASASASGELGKASKSNAAAHGADGGAGAGTEVRAQQRRPLPIVLPSANEHTKLTLQRGGLDMLRSIKGPVAPVVVIGPYRSGRAWRMFRAMSQCVC
jgi:hypothetical protein